MVRKSSRRISDARSDELEVDEWAQVQNIQKTKPTKGTSTFEETRVSRKRTKVPYAPSADVPYQDDSRGPPLPTAIEGKPRQVGIRPPLKAKRPTRMLQHRGFEEREKIDPNREVEIGDDWDIPTHRRHKGELGIFEQHAQKNIEQYKDSFGELLRSPIPGALFRWQSPDGKKTDSTTDIWASDSGFYFASEPGQKSSRGNQSQNLLSMTDILVKGNKPLADTVKKCRVCQRDSYYLYPKNQFDEEGWETQELTQQEQVCRKCKTKGIIQSKQRKKKGIVRFKDESDKQFKKRKHKQRTSGYIWDQQNLHNQIKPFEQTILPIEKQGEYRQASEGDIIRNPDGRIEQSEKVSRFLRGIFDF
jgi:hypothetical protein